MSFKQIFVKFHICSFASLLYDKANEKGERLTVKLLFIA